MGFCLQLWILLPMTLKITPQGVSYKVNYAKALKNLHIIAALFDALRLQIIYMIFYF